MTSVSDAFRKVDEATRRPTESRGSTIHFKKSLRISDVLADQKSIYSELDKPDSMDEQINAHFADKNIIHVQAAPYLHSLNLLRILLTVWVVFFHVAHWMGYRHPTQPNFVGMGNFSVECFYLLSGFVHFGTGLAKFESPGASGFGGAYLENLVTKFFRVWPLHALITLIFFPVDKEDCNLLNTFTQITFTQFLTPNTVISCNVPSWFLHEEWYLCWLYPFLFALPLKSTDLGTGLWIAAACLLGFWAYYTLPLWDRIFAVALTRAVTAFTLGLAVGWTHTQNQTKEVAFDLLTAIVAVSIYLLLDSPVTDIHTYHLSAFVLFAALVYSVARAKLLNDLCNNSTVAELSKLSFGIYLIHWLILGVIGHSFPSHATIFGGPTFYIFGLGTWLLAYALAIPLHYLVEVRGRRLGKTLIDYLNGSNQS